MEGTAYQYAMCGIIPMIPPTTKDLRAIMEDLVSRCQIPAPGSETTNEARDLVCDLCCGNYGIFEEALLAFNGVGLDLSYVNPGMMLMPLNAVRAGALFALLSCLSCDVHCR